MNISEKLTTEAVLTEWLKITNDTLAACLRAGGWSDLRCSQKDGTRWHMLNATVTEHMLAPGRVHFSIREVGMHEELRGEGIFGRFLDSLECDPRVAEISVANIQNPRLRSFLVEKRAFRDEVIHALKRPRLLRERESRWGWYQIDFHTRDFGVLNQSVERDPRWTQFRALLHEVFPGCQVKAASAEEHLGVRVNRDLRFFERWLPEFLLKSKDLDPIFQRAEAFAQICGLWCDKPPCRPYPFPRKL